jgi:hypothetical protein
MTKNFLYLIFIIAVITAMFFFLKKEKTDLDSLTIHSTSTPSPVIDVKNQTFDNKKVVGLKTGEEKEQLENLTLNNHVSKDWENILEQNLLEQGGESIKSIQIKKVDSFIWKQDGVALHVESVTVSLKNQDNAESSFRALVDAQTGKILKTWDQPVFDPAHPKDNFKIKIDPRYHNQ